MPTDPLTGSRYPDLNAAPHVPQDIQNAVWDLSDNTIPRFATTADRDTAYTAYAAGGGVVADGMVCFTSASGGTWWQRLGGAWKVLSADGGWLNVPLNSPFTAGFGGAVYRVRNRIVYFTVRATRTTSWTGPVTLWTFPTGARPAYNHYFRAIVETGAGSQTTGSATVLTTGVVSLSLSGGVNDNVFMSGSFPND